MDGNESIFGSRLIVKKVAVELRPSNISGKNPETGKLNRRAVPWEPARARNPGG